MTYLSYWGIFSLLFPPSPHFTYAPNSAFTWNHTAEFQQVPVASMWASVVGPCFPMASATLSAPTYYKYQLPSTENCSTTDYNMLYTNGADTNSPVLQMGKQRHNADGSKVRHWVCGRHEITCISLLILILVSYALTHTTPMSRLNEKAFPWKW